MHILRSIVGSRRTAGTDDDDDIVGAAAAHDGGLRQDTVEVCFEDWLVAQLLGDSVALLDWQLQRELTGVAKRPWRYPAGRSPDFQATMWPGEEI